ncbi:MAG: hypothetical protein WAL95_18350 [Candidatus Acidiferrales bacterium]
MLQTNNSPEQTVHIYPSGTRILAILAGCVSAFAGFLAFGIVFLFVPVLLILGAIIQPSAPRLGRWVFAAGAMLVTVYVGLFLVPLAFGMVSMLRQYHTAHDIGLHFLFALSIVLVASVDVALVMSERARTKG